MMEFLWFIAGIAAGIAIATILALRWSTRATLLVKDTLNSASDSVKKLAQDPKLLDSVRERISRVTEIADKQEVLIISAQTPSASASHARYKNTLIRELKALEQEKMDIFKSIVNDGIDLKMKTTIDGKEQIISMSEILKKYEDVNPPASVTPMKQSNKTDTNLPKKKNPLRLVVNNRGDKDESGDPKVH